MTQAVNNRFFFNGFEVDPARRLLLRGGEVIPIKAKTFDLLLTLVEGRGEILSKDELLNRVWQNQFVEENNLTVHVAALRKALGESKNENRYIVTVPGKGYRFVAPVKQAVDEVIVERHSLSRIIVEEQIEEADGEPLTLPPAKEPTGYRRLVVTGIAALLMLVAGGWLYRSTTPAPDQPAAIQFTTRTFTTGGGGIPDRVAISPDGKTIAFVQRRKGKYSLHLGELAANNSVEIVAPADRLYRYLSFSPDGKSIYFTARDSSHFEPSLMKVSILGGAVTDLIADVQSSYAFSPDGSLVAFLRVDGAGGRTSLTIAHASNGQNEKILLSREGIEDAIGAGIAFSPDGRAIAFSARTGSGYQLMTASLNDGVMQPIGGAIKNRIVHLAWLKDGSGIVTLRNIEPHPNDGQIWFVSYPSGEARLITDEILTYSFASLTASSDNKIAILHTRSDPDISIAPGGDLNASQVVLSGTRARGEGMNGVCLAPDNKILFTAVVNDSRTIWEMNIDGSAQNQLTALQKDSGDEQISVTPDNRFIVFQSSRTGSLEVWRANRDGSDARPLTSGGENSQPVIAPDGMTIIYISLRDGKYGLRKIAIDGGEPVIITTELSTWPVISPDGRMIAFSYGRSSRYPNREIRVIDAKSGQTIKTFQVPLAAVLYNRLRWSPDGRSLIYKDHTQGLWQQSLSTDEPEEIGAPDDLRIYHFAYSADGSMVFSGGRQMREIVILEPTDQKTAALSVH